MNRWIHVVVGFLIMLMFGMIYAWSVFVLPLEKEFGWSREQTSLTFSLTMMFFSMGILLGGVLTDKKGPRLVSAVAGAFIGIGFFSASFTTSLLQLYISYSVICGLSVGVAYNCVISTVIRWFPDKRGLVSGLLMMGFGFGGLVLGLGASRLIEAAGWRNAFQILGALILVTIIALGRVLCLPPPDWKNPAAEIAEGRRNSSARDYAWREVIKIPAFWLMWFWQVSVISGGLATIGHIVPLAVEKGFANNQAAYALGILSIFNGIGRVTFGFLSDRWGRRASMLTDSLIMVTAMLLFATILPQWGFNGLLLSAILVGLAYGGSMPQVSSGIAAFFGPKHFGANFGMVSTGVLGASLLGPYMSGYVKTALGSYSYSFFILAGVACIGMIVSACIRNPQKF